MKFAHQKIILFYNRFYYTITFLLAIGILYSVFPKQGNFKYEFQKGKPWKHESLIAPFDFPILKPAEIYNAEKDSVTRSFSPFFLSDDLVKSKQQAKLEQDVRMSISHFARGLSKSDQETIVKLTNDLIAAIYDQGIIENTVESFEPLKDKVVFMKVLNSVGTECSVSSLYSLKSAYVALVASVNQLNIDHPKFRSVIQQIDFNQYLEPNLFYDSSSSEMHLAEMLDGVASTRGVVQSGVRVISQGDIVTTETYQILESLKYSYLTQSAYSGWVSLYMTGQLILIVILLFAIVIYLQNFNSSIFKKKRNFSFILTSVIITFLLAWLVGVNQSISIYIFPICILPIIIRTFLGARVAIFIHVITVLLIGFLAPNSFEYVMIQIVAGAVAVISLNKMYRRGHLVITSTYLLLTYALMFIGFSLVKEGTIESINWGEFKWFAMSSVFTLIAYPLIYIFERIFGFVSDVTLMELSDSNNPLLRKLAEEAPGTFQHSMQVANLAEEVALRIGGNPMLIRTGALYHDVGKINKSNYFIENQMVGQNPHESMDYILSASVVIDHVNSGVVLARKYKVPESIIDFIKMHHGKGMAKYFYLKYKEEHPDVDVKPEDFSYPGPNPQTRETAIVMLADSVEAAVRSLPEKNEESIKKLINQIIDSRVNSHELDDAPITFKDIKRIKEIFLEKLKTVYHIRIQYPQEK